jgi:hypothetical protein
MASAPTLSQPLPHSDHSVKHLEMIQAVIARMGQNSFFVKGWSIALVTATLAVASQQLSVGVSLLALFPASCFWYLDAYYLRQERLYRRLFNHVAANGEAPDHKRFSLDTSPFSGEESLRNAASSLTVAPTHGVILIVIAACIVAGIIRIALI